MTSTSSATSHTDPRQAVSPTVLSWAEIIITLLDGEGLSAAQTAWAMGQVVRGEATPAQIAGFATALRAKGESAEEIQGLINACYEHATMVRVPGTTVDIVGTGGDRTGAANISTMAALVVAATGTTVVKHGGRAASSVTCGAADLVERLGVSLELTPTQAARIAAQAGITFLFAPRFHPGLRHASAARRELAIPTVFNILGPLINPAQPAHQLVGVAAERMMPVIAEVLAARGCSALVVRGQDGLDKLTTVTRSQVWVVRDGAATPTVLDPEDLGISRADPSQLRGGDPANNLRIVQALLDGKHNAIRDAVLLNAAAALVTLAPSPGSLTEQIAERLEQCAEAIDTGAAKNTLQRWVAVSHQTTHASP